MRFSFSVKDRIFVYILFIIVLNTTRASAQDPELSQFYASPMYTNPAFAGSSIVGRAVINARSQWPNIAGSLRTIAASYDEHFDFVNGGLGMIVTQDEAGVGTFRTFSASGVYSYQIKINRYVTMRAGIQAAFVQKTVDFSKLVFYDQIAMRQGIVGSTTEPLVSNSVYFANFSAGLLLYTSRFYAGAAVHNLNEPNQAFFGRNQNAPKNQVPRKYTGHAGVIIPINQTRNEKRASNLWPNIIYMQQLNFNQLNVGMYYNRGAIVFGLYYRQNSVNSDAAIALIGFRNTSNKVRIGVSYDQTLSNAIGGAPNSWELSLAFELRKKVPRRTIRPMRCPEF